MFILLLFIITLLLFWGIGFWLILIFVEGILALNLNLSQDCKFGRIIDDKFAKHDKAENNIIWYISFLSWSSINKEKISIQKLAKAITDKEIYLAICFPQHFNE